VLVSGQSCAITDRVGRQRSGRDDGQVHDERFTGSGRARQAGPGGEDRTHVRRAEPTERDRSFERGDQDVGAVGGFESGELVEVRRKRRRSRLRRRT